MKYLRIFIIIGVTIIVSIIVSIAITFCIYNKITKEHVYWQEAPLIYLNEKYNIPIDELTLLEFKDFHFPKSTRGGRDYTVEYKGMKILVWWTGNETWKDNYLIIKKNMNNIEKMQNITEEYFEQFQIILDPFQYDLINPYDSLYVPDNTLELKYAIFVLSNEIDILNTVEKKLNDINISHYMFAIDDTELFDFIKKTDYFDKRVPFELENNSELFHFYTYLENGVEYYIDKKYEILFKTSIGDMANLKDVDFTYDTVILYDNLHDETTCYILKISKAN